jgi:hypothetical protein
LLLLVMSILSFSFLFTCFGHREVSKFDWPTAKWPRSFSQRHDAATSIRCLQRLKPTVRRARRHICQVMTVLRGFVGLLNAFQGTKAPYVKIFCSNPLMPSPRPSFSKRHGPRRLLPQSIQMLELHIASPQNLRKCIG